MGETVISPSATEDEPKADILVIETPDVDDIQEEEEEVKTPETLVNEPITVTSEGEKSVDHARERSPTPQVESEEDDIEVVEPTHVETNDKKEELVDKSVENKEILDKTDGISDAYVTTRAAKDIESPSGN